MTSKRSSRSTPSQAKADRTRYILLLIFFAGAFFLSATQDRVPLVARNSGTIVVWCLTIVGAIVLAWLPRKDPTFNGQVRGRYLPVALVPWIALALLVANALGDSSPAVLRVAVVRSRFSVQHRRGTQDYVEVPSWNQSGRLLEVPVTHECYDKLATADVVTILEKRGVFRFAWIAGIAECQHQRP